MPKGARASKQITSKCSVISLNGSEYEEWKYFRSLISYLHICNYLHLPLKAGIIFFF